MAFVQAHSGDEIYGDFDLFEERLDGKTIEPNAIDGAVYHVINGVRKSTLPDVLAFAGDADFFFAYKRGDEYVARQIISDGYVQDLHTFDTPDEAVKWLTEVICIDHEHDWLA